MKADSLFYRIFLEAPEIFFRLIQQPPELAARYKFDSVEVKQTAFRLDGVFIPRDKRSRDLIYFVEVQFQRDRDFYWRFLAEVALFLKHTKPTQAWQAIVIWPRRSLDCRVPEAWQFCGSPRSSHNRASSYDHRPQISQQNPSGDRNNVRLRRLNSNPLL